MQRVAVYGEGDVMRGEGQMVDAARVVLASGAARVLAQHFYEAFELVVLYVRLQRFGKSTSSSCQGTSSMKPPLASGWQSAKGI